MFRWEFIRRQVRHKAFKRAVRNREPYDTQGQVVSVQGAIGNIVKGSICIHIPSIKAFFHRDRLFMAAHKGDIYRNVKRVRIREVKIPDKAFGMDVLCEEEEVLSLFHDGEAKEGLLKKVKVEPSAARKRKPGPASAWRAELKRWKTASNASGRSLARCWLKAEADGEPACRPKKSSSSILVPEEPKETRKEMSLSAPIFLERVKSLPGLAVYWEMLDTTWLTASAKAALMSSCDIIMYLLGIGLMFLSPISRAALTTSKIHQ